MKVTIFQDTKTAMQSGKAKEGRWILEYDTTSARRPEPLMGWQASEDTLNQVRLKFESYEDALAYAQKKGWNAKLLPPQQRKIKPRSYMDNFKYRPPEGEGRS